MIQITSNETPSSSVYWKRVSLFKLCIRYETPRSHMPRLTLQALGLKLIEKRGDRGVREVAKALGTSPATLSRVERGHLPDLETFGKICRWLDVDPGEILGTKPEASRPIASAQTHFRKDQAVNAKTAAALADLIIKAHEALVLLDEGEEFSSLV